jgi:hypothetical protein
VIQQARNNHRNDDGAALILVLGFIVFVGAITSGLLGYITTTVRHRVPLDAIRAREYAADGGVEWAIAQVRGLPQPGQSCPPPPSAAVVFNPPVLNGVPIRVDCLDAPETVRSGIYFFVQRNVVFTACEGAAPCDDSNAIVRAQVNYQAPVVQSGPAVITRTYVQSWSVNR